MTYILQLAEKSVCMYCHKYVELLVDEHLEKAKPMFYICFDCRKVFVVGKGEVRRDPKL